MRFPDVEHAATVEKVSANVGGLSQSPGELIEILMAARLWEKFPGYSFKRIFQRIKILDEHNVSITEIDILLSNFFSINSF